MRAGAGIFLAAVGMAMSVGGCSTEGGEGAAGGEADGPLTCAALISAADRLIFQGKIPRDPEVLDRGLVTSMTYLNQHSIPQGIGEKEAFAQVHAERDRLLAALPAPDIVSRAKACIQRMPPT